MTLDYWNKRHACMHIIIAIAITKSYHSGSVMPSLSKVIVYVYYCLNCSCQNENNIEPVAIASTIAILTNYQS